MLEHWLGLRLCWLAIIQKFLGQSLLQTRLSFKFGEERVGIIVTNVSTVTLLCENRSH